MINIRDGIGENSPLRVVIEMLVFKGKAIMCLNIFVMEVIRCGVLAISIQSFLSYCCKPQFDIEVSLPVIFLFSIILMMYCIYVI